MQPTEREGRRLAGPSALVGFVFALFCFLSMSGAALAQIDIGDRWWLVAGSWGWEMPSTPAWVDPATWTLATRMESVPLRVASDPQPNTWMPVAGDFDGDGVDSVLMFEPSTWRLVRLEDGPVENASEPPPLPWVAVAGDWDGRGVDTVRVFDLRDGSLHDLAEGPIRVDRYEPDPLSWRPLVGDFTGAGIDKVAVWRDENAGDGSEWVQLAGDWDGDGIDTFGAVYVPTGDLVDAGIAVFASRAAAASTAPGSARPASLFEEDNKSCWTFSKKIAETVHSFQYPRRRLHVHHHDGHREVDVLLPHLRSQGAGDLRQEARVQDGHGDRRLLSRRFLPQPPPSAGSALLPAARLTLPVSES